MEGASMSLSYDNSAITSSVPHTGDALLGDIALTGWSADIGAISQGGKLFFKVTTGDVLELYSDDARSNRVAYGSISSDAVTLAQDNSSGLSGSARVSHTSGTESIGVIVLSYADETDLARVFHSPSGYLDSSNQWAGGDRYEQAFLDAKVIMDEMIAARVNNLPVKANNTLDTTAVVITRAFRTVHARLTAYVLEAWKGSIDVDQLGVADDHRRQAERLWKSTQVYLNTQSDNTADGIVSDSSVMRG
jgi:hypothetical protein